MSYKLSFTASNHEVDIYVMEFVNGFPTRFQVFVDHTLEGFMSYGDKWIVDKYSLAFGILNEALAEEIGNYLIAYYS